MRALATIGAAVAACLAASGTAVGAPPFAFEFAGPGTPAPGALGSVGGDVAVDSEGSVWVEDTTANRVVKYDSNGAFVAEFVHPAGLDVPLDNTTGIGADAAAGVYIVDANGARVVKLGLGGGFVRTYGTGGTAPLTTAQDVAVGADGVVHVLEAGRIARFRQDGTPIGDVTLPPTLGDGRDLALAPSGAYYVNAASRVVRLSSVGAELNSVAVFASGEGIALDTSQPAPRVYGRFSLSGVVEEYTATLTPVGDLSSQVPGPSQISQPTGIAADCRGSVYVVDRAPAGGRIVKFDDPATPPPPCTPPPPLAGTIDSQVNDMDVTQGTQWLRDYTAGDAVAGARQRSHGDAAAIPSVAEVPMRAGGKTVVRVYANVRTGPPGGIANVPLTLTGVTSRGRRLGTIMPDAAPPLLRVGDARVEPAERTDPSIAHTFTLPDSWTEFGRLDLTARVNPAAIGCDAACQARSTFRVTGIPFQLTAASCLVAQPRIACSSNPFGVDIWPISLRVDGVDPAADPKPLFDVAQALTPVRLMPWGWMGNLEVRDIANQGSTVTETCTRFLGLIELECTTTVENFDFSTPEGRSRARDVMEGRIFERIERFKQDRKVGSSTIVLGLIGPANPLLPGAMRGDLGVDVGARGYAVVTRPITALAHELQHAFARPHAGQNTGCYPDPDQVGQAWPDGANQGTLLGWGLDTRAGSGGARTPYRLIVGAATSQWFDLMSYCGGERNTWMSPFGWNQIIGYKAPGGAVPNSRPSNSRIAGAPGRLIRVTAVERADGSLLIAGTSPDRGEAVSDPSVLRQLEARDAAGAVLATAPLSADVTADGTTLLSGAVSAPSGTTQVVVRRGAEAATRRRRSANAPTVRLLSPLAGARLVGRNATVSWRSADRDGDALTATVEVSLDGGRSYRPVSVGPSTGRVRIATSVLGDSRNARIRVRVDDGFAEAQAASGRLTIVGPPPSVRIVSPVRGQRVRADAPLRLEAEATAAGGRPLRSQAFAWQDGTHSVGRGITRTVTGLRPGRHVIRVTATDGRSTSTVSVPITVAPVRPAFLRLDSPARLTVRARTVRLRVASTVDANLIVAGRRFAVGPVPRTVALPVRTGSTPLRLTLRLRAGGFETRQAIIIPRP